MHLVPPQRSCGVFVQVQLVKADLLGCPKQWSPIAIDEADE